MRLKYLSFILFIATIGILISQSSFIRAAKPVQKAIDLTPNCGSTRISKPNAVTSHFFGLNCGFCHTEGRKGKGCFTVAGSVLDEDRSRIRKNPVVKLYSEPLGKGKLIATIYGDALGNFYTTENVKFPESFLATGLYPTLVGSPKSKERFKHMLKPIFKEDGNCNKCHGKSAEALGID